MTTLIGHADGKRLNHSPLERYWDHSNNPLPVSVIRAPGRSGSAHAAALAPPWIKTGSHHEPFDFCLHVRRLSADVVRRTKELHHIDVERVLVSVTQARGNRAHGLQARVTPMRFRTGMLTRRHGNRTYQVQRYFVGEREMLYVMSFCLPRFLNQDFDNKFITLFHELYHIGTEFDGDLRRHQGRCSIHSNSRRGYDAYMADLARAYLAEKPDPALHGFLRLNFAQLQHRHGAVLGVVVPRPKLIPVSFSKTSTG